MGTVKVPQPIRRKNDKSQFWWLRKKVPLRYRDLVGKAEVWRSLRTTEKRAAFSNCAIISAQLEAEWAALAGEIKDAAARPATVAEPAPLSHKELHALRAVAHMAARDVSIENPTLFARLRLAATVTTVDADDEQALNDRVREFLAREGISALPVEVERFRPLFIQARLDAARDLRRAADGDYSDNPILARLPARSTPRVDLLQAFEEYVSKGGLKEKSDGPTAKRWRPKIQAFAKWLGHRDLAKMTTADGYRWADHLQAEGYAEKSIRDVWIASLSATAGFMVERRLLDQNPFVRIRVRNSAATNAAPPRKKGFTKAEAEAILTATLETPSHLISEETAAARRWLPWLCAYSGARVNEVTSLSPEDVARDLETDIWCFQIKPDLEKTAQWRTVPLHSHVIEQGFLDYVDRRRKTGKPLFYDPDRGRGGKAANPQFKKVAERLAEWLHSKKLIPAGVKPNHGWRHAFKAAARRIPMDREVEGFVTGHRPKESGASFDYGDRWVETMSIEVEKYQPFRIPALKSPPGPHQRRRRTRAQIEVDNAAKAARMARRATRVVHDSHSM